MWSPNWTVTALFDLADRLDLTDREEKFKEIVHFHGSLDCESRQCIGDLERRRQPHICELPDEGVPRACIQGPWEFDSRDGLNYRGLPNTLVTENTDCGNIYIGADTIWPSVSIPKAAFNYTHPVECTLSIASKSSRGSSICPMCCGTTDEVFGFSTPMGSAGDGRRVDGRRRMVPEGSSYSVKNQTKVWWRRSW